MALKMRMLVFVLIISPLLLTAQQRGVEFSKNLSWQQILDLASKDNKYVFVDCYASWCQPCRWMDEHIYSNDSIANYLSDKFICVKICMDSSSLDEKITKELTSNFIVSKDATISEYPTYLFFSSNGRLLHMGLGAMKKQEFISLINDALDGRKQFFQLLALYQQGSINIADVPFLIHSAEKLHKDSLASVIAEGYLHKYVASLEDGSIWSSENLSIIEDFRETIHARDTIFRRYFKDRVKIDSIAGINGYANRLINFVIYRDEIGSFVSLGVSTGIEPEWSDLQKTIRENYGDIYVDGNILKGRIEYYHGRKMWDKYVEYFIKKMGKSNVQKWPAGKGSMVLLNNDAWEVFTYSKKRRELEIALTWIDLAEGMSAEPNATVLDTKANILYKLGKKSEALALEEKSHALDPADAEKTSALDKMRQGLPTW